MRHQGVEVMADVEARPTLRVGEAVAFIGLSQSTVQRRCDLWEIGERDNPRALKCTRSSGAVGRREGERLIDRADAERMRDQVLGRLAPSVTAEQYAAGVRTPPG
jgi:hypothetical protein